MAEAQPNPDEEYQFSDLEAGEAYTEAARPPRGGGGRFLKILILIAILYGAYQLMGVLFPTKKKVTPAPTPMVEEQPAPMLPQLGKPVADDKLKERLQDISQRSEASQGQIERLGSDMAAIRGSVGSIERQMDDINITLQKLSTIIREQQNRLNRQESLVRGLLPKPEAAKPVVKEAVSRPLYYVQAIVPGRAWLVREDGKTLTISRGDRIPGYGEVHTIDPQEGRVIMTSGDTLYYHPEDR